MADSVKKYPAEWTAIDQQSAGLATATQTAETGRTHFITGVLASYATATDIGVVEIKSGTTVLARINVHESAVVELPSPLRCAEDEDAVATLAAGTANGDIAMFGYTTN